MKIKTAKPLITFLLFATFGVAVKAQTIEAWVQKYTVSFDNDGTGKLLASAQFGEVPASEQAEVLARILDKLILEKPINSNAVSGTCSTISIIREPWTDHLKKSINALLTSSDYITRCCGLHLLTFQKMGSTKSSILSFQNDPDDRVRANLMNEIRLWPDAEPIFQKYIQKHEDDPNYVQSLQSAQTCLAINREMLKRIVGPKKEPNQTTKSWD